MTVANVIKPFIVTSGRYKFRFVPEDVGFSVSCTNVRGINTQGDTFEEALENALKAAIFVEECIADIEAEKTKTTRRGKKSAKATPPRPAATPVKRVRERKVP